jgi:hypothetical protein
VTANTNPRDRAADLAAGRAAKDAGSQLALDANAEWKAAALEAMEKYIRLGIPFTSDDITDEVGEPPHPNAMGGLFSGGFRNRLKVVGTTESTRKAAHARLIRVWQAKRSAA